MKPNWLKQAEEKGLVVGGTIVNREALGQLFQLRLGAKVSERAFQTDVIELAQTYCWRVAHFRAVRVQRKNGDVYYETPVAADGKGFPDLILVRQDRLIAAELKVPPNKPTPEQIAWLGAFGAIQGCLTAVWYPADLPEIEKTLR